MMSEKNSTTNDIRSIATKYETKSFITRLKHEMSQKSFRIQGLFGGQAIQ